MREVGAHSKDTSAEVDELLFERLRSMSPEARAIVANRLMIDITIAARAGIAAAGSCATEEEVRRELCRRRYGDSLAAAAYGEPSS